MNQTSRKFYVDLYGEASVSVIVELGLYFKFNAGKYEFNLGGGVKINLGDFKDGMKYEKSNGVESSKKHQLNLYSEISSLKIDAYIYIEFKIIIKEMIIPITIRVDLVKELFEGFKYTIYEISPKNTKLFISTLASKLLIFFPPGNLGKIAFVSSYFVIGYISKKDKI